MTCPVIRGVRPWRHLVSGPQGVGSNLSKLTPRYVKGTAAAFYVELLVSQN